MYSDEAKTATGDEGGVRRGRVSHRLRDFGAGRGFGLVADGIIMTELCVGI